VTHEKQPSDGAGCWRRASRSSRPFARRCPAGLYKTQVHDLAGHLGVTGEILTRPPTTDAYSLAQSQEDFFFSLPYAALDVLLWAKNRVAPDTAAAELGYSPEQVQRVYDDIDQKRRTTAYLHAAPILLEPVDELPGI